MHLYEVIRWGNDSDDPLTGGPNGPDTCFLVRAQNIEAAAALVDRELRAMQRESTTEHAAVVAWWATAVYLLGDDAGSVADGAGDAMILRGPYFQHAHRHGWRHWYREAAHEQWVERRDT